MWLGILIGLCAGLGLSVTLFLKLRHSRLEILALKQVDQMKSEFLSTVSHELRTPLTSIGGYCRLLLDQEVGPLSDPQKEFLSIIDTNVARLTHLINDLLDAEKIGSGKIQLLREPVLIEPILEECFQTLKVLADKKGIELHLDLVGLKGIQFLGDRKRMLQVVVNLISNAIKYTAKGQVSISGIFEKNLIRITIQDSGIGMSDEDKKKVFQKFFRAGTALKSEEGGTGLGLSIAKGIVESHGGKIEFDSKLGSGTTFSLLLPAQFKAVKTSVRKIEISKPDNTIWFLDRNTTNQPRILRMFEKDSWGSQIKMKFFGSIDEIPHLNDVAEPPSVVIIDSDTVGEEYFEIFHELRLKLPAETPTIVLGDAKDALDVYGLGASLLLTKPVKKERLIGSLQSILKSKGARILLGEHNGDLRILTKRALEHSGFDVDDADDGHDFIQRLRQGEYSLAVFSDDFEDLSAEEILEITKRMPELSEVPIFLILQERNLSREEGLRNLGAKFFVSRADGVDLVVDTAIELYEEKKVEQFH